ncbi:Reducing polyketide synthase boa9 [Clarireedia jacksonii]
MPSLNSSAADVKYPEPIAIVGIWCRFPGDSDSPSELWQMLLDERHGRCKPPLSRYNIDGFGANKNPPGKMKPMEGYFINEGIWSFDPSFFGIVDAEAAAIDPQQRKLLECVYEAFESGGITLAGVAGTNTGVYVGNFTYDYYLQGTRSRLTLLYSFTLDSACSSSLYALHLASRALASGEIDGAVVGGVNLMLAPEVKMSNDQIGTLSGTSTSHKFDTAADGYGRAEGIGALYLKRLSVKSY